MALRTTGPRQTSPAGTIAVLARRLVLTGVLSGLPADLLPPLARPDGTPAPTAGIACQVVLAGQDASGQTLFRTIALALARPGLVVTPLHTLERGGARWERLNIEGEFAAGRGGAADVATVVSLDPVADLAYLHAPGLPACPEEASEREAGTAVLVLRERSGFRPAVVGGQVVRSVDLPDGRRLILVRLLDVAGADPGLLVDVSGSLIGSVAPAPPGGESSLAVVVRAAPAPLPSSSNGGEDRAPRLVMPPRPAPSFSGTLAGLVAQALLLAGSGRTGEALERLEEAIGRGGETVPLLLERGALLYASGRLPAAVADFSRASQTDPSSYLARFNLGIALGASGRYSDAADAFRQARDLAPSNPRARFELALALRAARQGDAARGEWEALNRLDPTLARELELLLGF